MQPLRHLAVVLLLVVAAACELPSMDAGLASIENSGVGLRLRELPRATLRSLNLSYGLAVVKAEAAAASAGLQVGDVVYGVNQKRIRSVVDFARLLAEQPPGAPVMLLVRRGATDLYLALDPYRRGPTDTLLRT
jgi:S1-C subfamily serine protease